MNLANQFNPISKEQQLFNKPVYTCDNCSVQFEKYKSNSKNNFCNRRCFYEYQKKNKLLQSPKNPDHIYKNGRPYKNINCDKCGTGLLRRTDQINQRGTGNYCVECVKSQSSEKNKGNTNVTKTGELVACEICSEKVYMCRYKVGTRRFCSKKCQHKWQAENVDIKFISHKLSGSEHPRFTHGKKVGKHQNKPKLRKDVADRDGGNWCLFCGKPAPGLHLHRVLYGSQGGLYELTNCVLLCGDHHGLVHTSKIKWQPLLIEHLNNPRFKKWLA